MIPSLAPARASDERWVGVVMGLALTVYVLVLGYALAVWMPSLVVALLGGPLWLVVAYRYPMVGIAVLSVGQFILRSLAGSFGSLSRGQVDLTGGPKEIVDVGAQSVIVGVFFFLPLVAAAVTKGDLGRIGRLWRQERLVMVSITVISAAVLVSYALRPSDYGGLKLIAHFGLNLPLFVLPVLLVRTEKHVRQLLVAVVIVSVLTLGTSLLGSVPIWSETALRGTHQALGELAGQSVDVGVWFARRVAIGGLAAVAILLMTRVRSRIPLWTAASCLLAASVLAASRAPVFGVAAALLVMVALAGGSPRSWGRRIALIVVVTAAAMAAFAVLPDVFADRYLTAFDFSDQSFQERLDEYEKTVGLIRDAPLFGVGLGRYFFALHGLDRIVYPHNLVLELAAELGVMVAVLFVLLVVKTLRVGLAVLRRTTNQWVVSLAVWAAGVQVLSFSGALVSGDLRTNEHVWLAAGLGLAASLVARSARVAAEPATAGAAAGERSVGRMR